MLYREASSSFSVLTIKRFDTQQNSEVCYATGTVLPLIAD